MRSIKVIGVSGSGKTTVIKEILRRHPEAVHLGYSEYRARYGAGAEAAWEAALAAGHPLYLFDEHLEFGNGDVAADFHRERTVGMVFLELSAEELLRRRLGDVIRQRDTDLVRAMSEQATAWQRAEDIARTL